MYGRPSLAATVPITMKISEANSTSRTPSPNATQNTTKLAAAAVEVESDGIALIGIEDSEHNAERNDDGNDEEDRDRDLVVERRSRVLADELRLVAFNEIYDERSEDVTERQSLRLRRARSDARPSPNSVPGRAI